jgi:hypothetical protein
MAYNHSTAFLLDLQFYVTTKILLQADFSIGNKTHFRGAGIIDPSSPWESLYVTKLSL